VLENLQRLLWANSTPCSPRKNDAANFQRASNSVRSCYCCRNLSVCPFVRQTRAPWQHEIILILTFLHRTKDRLF